MSALSARMRSLAQQAGATRTNRAAGERPVLLREPAPEADARPTLRTKPAVGGEAHRAALRRLLGLRERAQARSIGTQPSDERVAVAIRQLDRRVDGDEIAPGLHRQEQRFRAPSLLLPDTSLQFESNRLDSSRLLFFDTETTGLAGGTGTRAFMIGAADFVDGELRVRQLTLTTMAAEASMLVEFGRWLRADTHLVSYNGRCYDAPLLATRYRLARLENPLADLAHLDLLHPVRRRYRGRWENCRMATIERRLLGIVRENDLPGAQAPMAWLGYLRGGSAMALRRVAEHNAQDLKSLAALLLALCRIDTEQVLEQQFDTPMSQRADSARKPINPPG